ncbi:Hypothetical predicted protein [Paramuricea clavata]|uniref:Uncharacterized protein n=1 Tax=Paramuricea clavata TaxID=317549 RepID=A0A7D9HXN4_PARCT|nr:Hypothetical predicted protein [Paramuricea clavata]
MDDKQMKQLLKLVLMALAATFAPIWIPVAVITVVPAFLILAGILCTLALGITTILTILLGVFGVPLLFSTAVTGMAYLIYKAFEKIATKVKCILKRSLSELNITGRIQSWFNLKKFLMVLPIINRFVDNGERQRAVYEEENETETVVSRIRRPSATRFPFPKASLPAFDLSDVNDGEEIEIFFNNVKELDSTIRVLLRKGFLGCFRPYRNLNYRYLSSNDVALSDLIYQT